MNKIQFENNKRLEILYNQSHKWLIAVAYNISKDKEIANELVGELYLYLAEKCNPSLWYLNSFNLMYAHSFIKSRFLNRIKADKRKTELSDGYDEMDTDYDIDTDEKLETAYNAIVEELKKMERTKQWVSSKLYQLYAFDKDMTLEKLAEQIGISKSTAFLQTKRAKIHLRTTIKNPFKSSPD